jgi:hypothetical protein
MWREVVVESFVISFGCCFFDYCESILDGTARLAFTIVASSSLPIPPSIHYISFLKIIPSFPPLIQQKLQS